MRDRHAPRYGAGSEPEALSHPRYLGRLDGATYAAMDEPGIVVRLDPGVLRGWDFVDEIAPDPGVPMWPSPGPG